jgi:hypothetical protein
VSRNLHINGLWSLGAVLLAVLLSPEMAFADNCGSFQDCFSTQRAAVAATVGLGVFATLLSLGLDFIPVVGTVKGGIEAITGKDLITGEKLEPWERMLGIVPYVGQAGDLAKLTKLGNLEELGGLSRAMDTDLPPAPSFRGFTRPEYTPDLPTRDVHPTYRFENGRDYDITYTGSRLRKNPSFQDRVPDMIPSERLTPSQFDELRMRSTEHLALDEVDVLKQIRESVELTDDTVMQKVIPARDVEKYISGEYHSVRGYVARAQDTAVLDSPAATYRGLRLDYQNSPFSESDEVVHVIRFRADDAGALDIPYGGTSDKAAEVMKGHVVEQPPFTGNGFTASPEYVIPEYKVNGSLELSDGAEMYRITADGKEALEAVYDARAQRFIRVAP